MKTELKKNNQDPTLLEDSLGNPMFRYLGIWPQEVDAFIATVNSSQALKSRIQELETEFERRHEN